MLDDVPETRTKAMNSTAGNILSKLPTNEALPRGDRDSRALPLSWLKKAAMMCPPVPITQTAAMRMSGPEPRSQSRLWKPPWRHAPGMAKADQSISK
eukprot:5183109-Prymnesium_polylepis.1